MDICKHWTFVLTIVLHSFAVLTVGAGLLPVVDDARRVILVLLDGFHRDYMDVVKASGRQLPTLDLLVKTGVRPSRMVNVYPTVTFPNLQSIVTGMTPDHHGVVHNYFYDPVLNDSYSMDSTTYTRFYNNGSAGSGGQPIWVTNQQQGHRSAVAVWPGSSAPIDDLTPTYAMPINYTSPWRPRVDHVVGNMSREGAGEAANLGLLYLEQPDEVIHHHGVTSDEAMNMVVEIDRTLLYLLQQLQAHKMDAVNLIIVSDHGMADYKGVVNLDNYIDPTKYEYHGMGTAPMLEPKPGVSESELVAALGDMPHCEVKLKTDLPASWHFTYNRRISPVLLIMEEGYQARSLSHKNSSIIASHGWPVDSPTMYPFFLANGPAFDCGFKNITINNRDVYPLLCELLGLEPHPHDGSLAAVHLLLRSAAEARADSCAGATWSAALAEQQQRHQRLVVVTVISFVVLVGLIVLIFCAVSYVHSHIGKTPSPGGRGNAAYRYSKLLSDDMQDDYLSDEGV